MHEKTRLKLVFRLCLVGLAVISLTMWHLGRLDIYPIFIGATAIVWASGLAYFLRTHLITRSEFASDALLALVLFSILWYLKFPSEAMALLVGATIGSALGLFFKIFEEDLFKPVIEIDDKVSIHIFHLLSSDLIKIKEDPTLIESVIENQRVQYHSNAILIRNLGERSAEGCKAELRINDRRLRVCWFIPKERPTATINAHSEELLEVCAIIDQSYSHLPLPRRIAPTEMGWDGKPRILDDFSRDEIKATLVITAKNANPKEVTIRILPFEKATNGTAIVKVDR